MEVSSEIILKFGGKNPKNKQKNTSKKPQQKTLNQQKNRTEQLPEDNRRNNGNQETGIHHVHSFRVPLMVLGFGSVFVWLPRPIYF